MRDKRTRGPGSQGPNDSRSKNDWLDEHLQPWAATPIPANDNALGVERKRTKLEPAPANDFADEATTLYQRERSWPNASAREPNQTAQPVRRPSARYRPQTQPFQAAKDEPGFGVEGSIPRSLRPGEVDRSRNYGVVLAGLLVIGLGTLWTMRGGAWSRAMLSLSAYSSSVASTRANLGQGHVVEPQRARPLHVTPLSAAATQAQAANVVAADVMEFELADVPADSPAHARVRGWSASAKHRHAQHAARHASASAALAKPIQPLIEKTEEDFAEPVYYRAAVNEGTLQVNSRPWSRVLVDGHFMGHTPQRALRLPAGLHRVLLVNDQLDMSKLFEVTISAGQVVTRVELLDESAHSSR
jgi:hypothetical protein